MKKPERVMMSGKELLPMNTKRRFTHSEVFIYRTIAGESLLIPVFGQNVSMDDLYALNEVGSFIWKAMEIPISVEDLFHLVADEYDQDFETIVSDVSEFISSMEEIGAIVEVIE